MSSFDTTVKYAYDGDEAPTEAVVAAITTASDREPLEMEPLYEFVDTDALNAVFRSRHNDSSDRSDIRIGFRIGAEHVTVTADNVYIHRSDER